MSFSPADAITDTVKPPEALPVSAEERIQTIDALRGFALLGILLFNMASFMGPMLYMVPGVRPETDFTIADYAARAFTEFFATAKFYNLFSFLFGLSFALQMIRAEKRGANVNRLFVRRFLALLGIGLVHAFLFWSGDILVTYALTGFFLLLFRHCSLKVAVIVAAILFGTTALAGLAGVAVMELLRLVPEARQKLGQIEQQAVEMLRPWAQEEIRAYGQGSLAAVIGARALQSLLMLFNVLGIGPMILAMFLLGLQVGRYDVLRHVEHYRPLLRKIILWGLIVGVPANLFYAWAMENLGMVSAFCAMVVNMGVGGPAFAFVYAAGLTLLLQRARWQRVFAPVAAAGRMALTNYLLHSLIGTTLAYGYGFGLFGRVAPAQGLLLALVIYALQLPFSVWWLRHFRFGPAEWVWRSLTYGRPQPMRRERREVAGPSLAAPGSFDL